MKVIILIIILILQYFLSFSQEAIYISPLGNDENKGTKQMPLKSLSKAIKLSRLSKTKLILIRGGEYYDAYAHLLPIDSGLIIKNYSNENPILYGGPKINHLYLEEQYICADLPESIKGWNFRMILVNGTIRPRSRLPENGYFSYLNKWDGKVLPQLYGSWNKKPTFEELSTLRYIKKDYSLWEKDRKSAEISLLHLWTESYLGVESADTLNQIIHFTFPATEAPGAFGLSNYVVWNTLNGIKKEGQWYWNKELNKIYYKPLKGENCQNIEIVIPKNNHIFDFAIGTKKITLEGLTISAANNQLQNEGFASTNIDSAIEGTNVSNITINNFKIMYTSGSGIKLNGANICISNTNIISIGGGGAYIGGKNVKIINCDFENMGLNYNGSVAIFVGDGSNYLIENCNICSTPYSGICIAGIIDSCLISNCKVKKSMTFMQDGAAIYCSHVNNTTIKNCFIIGNNTKKFSMGIYFDELSENNLAENNLVLNSGIPIHCHLATNIKYFNNIFIDGNVQHINYGRSSNISIDNNIFICPSEIFSGPSEKDNKVDTIYLESKLRKYANPTGISSFRDNLIMITAIDSKTSASNLPLIDQNLLSGTVIKKCVNKEICDLKSFINDHSIKKYINVKKLKLNSKLLNELQKEAKQ